MKLTKSELKRCAEIGIDVPENHFGLTVDVSDSEASDAVNANASTARVARAFGRLQGRQSHDVVAIEDPHQEALITGPELRVTYVHD